MIRPKARELHGVKGVLVDRAYNEFCKQREQGVTLNADQFCDDFPSIRSELIMMTQAHLYLADNAELAGEEKDAILWPEIGETFLDFDLLQELGIGSFARVFLAAEPKLGNRLVAVKIERDFGLAEAKVLGRLKHPNIVPVYSVQHDAVTGLTAVCMPYVGSATLHDVLYHVFSQPTPQPRASDILDAARNLKHPLDAQADSGAVDLVLQNRTYVDAVRALGAQLAEALAFIHGLGICHRDLKPSNVLLSPQGVPMLLDFNLSIDATDESSFVGGTMPYMSPEQLQGMCSDGHAAPITLDGRSDIFSLGVILFELLTGQNPFGPAAQRGPVRELREQLLQRHLAGAPSARQLNADIDRAFSRLIDRCLAYNPNDRPQSAAEIAAALRKDLTPQRRARRWISRHPQAMVAGLVLCLSLGLVGAATTVYGPRRELPMEAGVRLLEQKQYAQARDKFSQAIAANPKDTAALFARGQTYQQMAATEKIFWQYAYNDFLAIDELKPDARNSACIGYCILQTAGPIEWARQRFQSAIDDGFVSAGVYHDLGYCQQQQLKLDDAEKSLNRAIELNPKMQAAYYTRGRVHWQTALNLATVLKKREQDGFKDEAIALRADIAKRLDAGIKDVESAIDIGPANVSLHHLAARLFAVAAGQGRPGSIDAALEHLGHAVKRGLCAKQFEKDGIFRPMFGDERFKALCKSATAQQFPAPVAFYVDPLK
jgi:serine/threonine protein kinase/Tfp pilus assembly protein PilF